MCVYGCTCLREIERETEWRYVLCERENKRESRREKERVRERNKEREKSFIYV